MPVRFFKKIFTALRLQWYQFYDYDSGTDPKAEMQSEIIEMKITGVQINFVIKQTFLFFY